MCDLEVIGDPSIFNVIHSVASLEKMLPTLDLRCEEKLRDGSGTDHWSIALTELLTQ